MSKDARIPVRVSSELKAAFEAAASAEGTSVSAWLRGLGEAALREHEFIADAEDAEFEPVGEFEPAAVLENVAAALAPFTPGA